MAHPRPFRDWPAGCLIAFALVMSVCGYFVITAWRMSVIKSATAYVQAIWIGYRDDRDKVTPLLIKDERKSRYILLGVPPGNTAHPRDWIIVNATPGGEIVTVPGDGRFAVACSYLTVLQREVNVDRKVGQFLASRCQH